MNNNRFGGVSSESGESGGSSSGGSAKKSRTYIIPAGISAFGVISALGVLSPITLGNDSFDGSSNSSNSSSHVSGFANEFLAEKTSETSGSGSGSGSKSEQIVEEIFAGLDQQVLETGNQTFKVLYSQNRSHLMTIVGYNNFDKIFKDVWVEYGQDNSQPSGSVVDSIIYSFGIRFLQNLLFNKYKVMYENIQPEEILIITIISLNLFVLNALHNVEYMTPLVGRVSALMHPIKEHQRSPVKENFLRDIIYRDGDGNNKNLILGIQEDVYGSSLLPDIFSHIGLRRGAMGKSHKLTLPNSNKIQQDYIKNGPFFLANSFYQDKDIVNIRTFEYTISSEEVGLYNRVFVIQESLVQDKVVSKNGVSHIGGGGKEDGITITSRTYYLEKFKQFKRVIDLALIHNLDTICLDSNFVIGQDPEIIAKRKVFYNFLCEPAIKDRKEVITWEQWCEYDFATNAIQYASANGYDLLDSGSVQTTPYGFSVDMILVNKRIKGEFHETRVIGLDTKISEKPIFGNIEKEDDYSDHAGILTKRIVKSSGMDPEYAKANGLIMYAEGRCCYPFEPNNFIDERPRVDKPLIYD